jgi:hypothetical protein
MGLPVVMSEFTKASFSWDIPGCVGSDHQSFAKCILDIHSDHDYWKTLRDKGISYIEDTHNRKKIMSKWSDIVNRSLNHPMKMLGTQRKEEKKKKKKKKNIN